MALITWIRNWIDKVRQFGSNKPVTPSDASPGPASSDLSILESTSEAKLNAIVEPDDTLLDRSRQQWNMGDWEPLANLTPEAIQNHPERGRLAVLGAAGNQALGHLNMARRLSRLALEWGCSKRLVSQILISGAYHSLGRAAIISGSRHQAMNYFNTAINIGLKEGAPPVTKQNRIQQEYTRYNRLSHGLDPHAISKPIQFIQQQAHPDNFVALMLELCPDNPLMLIASAELEMRNKNYPASIRLWQRLASVEGAKMSQAYYSRLAQAYGSMEGFPLGAEDEEKLKGELDKYKFLENIHHLIRPCLYLEIGVQSGKSLSLAKCKCIGIDPMLQIGVPLKDTMVLFRKSSDAFFEEDAERELTTPIDLAFIDGMHFFEFALRDFMNVERYSSRDSIILIDDIYPAHRAQANRERRTRAWTGDIWKLFKILKHYRPELTLRAFDVYPTGMLVVSGLVQDSRILQENYPDIVREYSTFTEVPDDILNRSGAIPCTPDELIGTLPSGVETGTG